MSDLELTVLGSASPYPRPGNACSGYLVSSATTRIWVDAGTGTLAELQRHIELEQLDAIWISHLHADHSADLLTAYYALLYADIRLEAPIPLFGPPGIADRLARFLTNSATRSPVESAFEVRDLTEVGDLKLTTVPVEHGIPAYAVRIEHGGRSIVYSGDTGPCADLTVLAEGCDVLLCEADSAESTPGHHTPEEAGETARAAGRLVVTHVGPFLTPRQAVERAASRYDGPIDYAEPGSVWSI
ncbi:MAG: MBL fold metallo-hydrolase [Kibdelosporangium sp.]